MGRVLLVEDHEELQRLLAEVIRELGHEAEGVNTSREAQLRLATGSYDLVIADICLPVDSGYKVAELAEALGIDTILMSGHPDKLHLVHLPKPFSLAEFVRLIAERLGIRRLTMTRFANASSVHCTTAAAEGVAGLIPLRPKDRNADEKPARA